MTRSKFINRSLFGKMAEDYVQRLCCVYCRDLFTGPTCSDDLREHIAAHHTKDKPYQCPECPKTFAQQSHLSAHLRTHTGERPYECEDCGRKFRQSGHLQNHQRRVHSGEKPLMCDHCNRSFSDLELHRRSKHTRERPYTCPQCGAKFAHPSNLQKHRRTVQCDGEHVCSDCKRTFSSGGHLKRHVETKHRK